ncbi:MAG: hypothetical protein ABSB97_07740 [Thermoplasmata archaeon]
MPPMPLHKTEYQFRVTLPASRERAFRWATDYRPTDLSLMGEEGRRHVEHLAENTILLTDIFRTARGPVTKVKLVHLLPDQFAWTNTHLAGPSRHSQFLYELLPTGRNRCQLRFTGLQVDHPARRPTASFVAGRARELVREDSATWRRLAAAMGRDTA